MKVEAVRISYKNPLVNKYLYNFPSLQELYAFNPYTKEGFRERRAAVLREYNADRQELVRILLPYNKALGCGSKTEENLQLLAEKDTLVVITGQQAGVFTGPLYTIYKTISVIQLARAKSEELGVPVVPVFWVASEDHDFFEVNHLDLINGAGALERITLEEEPEGKFSIGHLPVGDDVLKLIGKLEMATNPSEWRDGLLEQVRKLANASENLADWFGRIMVELFKDHGLILVNPLLPGMRRLWSPLFEQFIRNSDAVNEVLQLTSKKVTDMGFIPQVEKDEEHLHLFRYIGKERLPLLKAGDLYKARGSEFSWTREELVQAVTASPEQFSPNVVLRPVAQDYALPLLAYVAGPGEIAYYGLYKNIYQIFGMSMPIIYPRAKVTLVEGNIVKLLERYKLDIRDVFEGLEEKKRAKLRELEEIDIEGTFEEKGQQIIALLEELSNELSSIDPSLCRIGDEATNKVAHQLNQFKVKALQAHRKKNEAVLRQFEKVETALYPKNNYQERVFNIYPFLFKHGPDLINQLLELPILEGVDHKLVYI